MTWLVVAAALVEPAKADSAGATTGSVPATSLSVRSDR
jgi:hypothetical protein